MPNNRGYAGAWASLLLAAVLTGLLAGGVLWPAPSLILGLGKAAWYLPLFCLAIALYSFISQSLMAGLRSSLPLILLFPATLYLLTAGKRGLAGSLGQTLARPIEALAGEVGLWLTGFVFLGLFVFNFVHALLKRDGLQQTIKKEPPASSPPIDRESRIFYPSRGFGSEASRVTEPSPGVPLRRSEEGYRFTTGISRRDLVTAFRNLVETSGARPPMISRLSDEDAGEILSTQFPQPARPDCSEEDLASEVFEPAEIVELPPLGHEPVPLTSYHEVEDESPAPQARPAKPPRPEISTRDYRKSRDYRKPDANLLIKSQTGLDESTREQMEQTARSIEQTFMEFGIEARVTNSLRGPVITQYQTAIPPGVRLSRVVALQDNLALSLAATSIRIEAPIPGKSAIGIEVPNKKRSMVTLRDILESNDFKQSKARIPLALGQKVSGQAMVADLAAMPHLIIAGTTGSGKSVCVNSIICSILFNMKPSQVRFILVDPKYVEMAPYNGIPHLLIPVINKPRAAILALKWLVREMEERYQHLQALGARNLESYNQRLREEPGTIDRESGQELEPIPYLVLVIDELADLMLLAAKEIEDSISRLAAMSRAVGIHLIFATQRPSVDVLTGVIKNNFPARIAFQVASNIDSRTILDSKGADKLLGKGDSLFVGPGSPIPLRVQGAYLSEEEVEKTAEYLRSLGSPLYRMEILDEPEEWLESTSEDFGNEDEPLYQEAIQIVIQTQRASASYLQRRLKVGYNRGARMIERMESEGIVGPQAGSKPRDVLVSHWP